MKKLITSITIIVILIGCKQENSVKELNGYVVYILPDKIRFVQTKGDADTNYVQHFSTNNFSNAISFMPNCVTRKIIESIKPDTLFDENPELKEYTTFMKYPLVFPAEITIVDTAGSKWKEVSNKKFKMIYKGNKVEFAYSDFNGVVIELHRTDK
jgi:hypothetical protein